MLFSFHSMSRACPVLLPTCRCSTPNCLSWRGLRRRQTTAWKAGERGLACLPEREAEFQVGMQLALDYAHALGCPRIHVMAWLIPAHTDPVQLRSTYIANLQSG